MIKEAICNVPNIVITLNENADIIQFHCTLIKSSYTIDQLFGENWFDFFIEDIDQKRERIHFAKIINNCNQGVYCYLSDIKCENGKHKLINFTAHCITIEEKKYITLIGIEHYHITDALKERL